MLDLKKAENKLLVIGGLIVLIGLVFAAGFWSTRSLQADTTTLTLGVEGGTLSIDGPDAIPFGNVTVSNALQNKEVDTAPLSAYFYVLDYLGSDAGYNTTLEVDQFTGVDLSGNVVGNIPAENVYIYTFSENGLLLTGNNNPDVYVNAALFKLYTAINAPTDYIYRGTGTNLGRIGTYYDQPRFMVAVPAYQPVGAYTNTLTRTLYPN